MSGSQEIAVFLRKHAAAFNRNLLTYYTCVTFNWVLSITKESLRIAKFFASLPFLIYLSINQIKD